MNHLAVSRGGGFHNSFRHGGVRVDGLDDFVPGGFQFAGHYYFGNQFGHVGANHVRAEPFAVFLVENNFHETVFHARRGGFAGGREREFTHQNVVAFGFGFGFGVAHAGDFGRGVGAAGDVLVVERLGVVAGDFLDADDAFGRGNVGQRGAGHNVTNGVNAGHVGLVEVVDDEPTALHINAQLFEANIFQVGGYAHGAQHHVALNYLLALGGFHGHFAAFAAGIHFGYFGAGEYIDADFAERFLHLARDFLVLHRHNAGQKLHQGHLRAHGAVEVGKLDANGPRAHHHEALGQLLHGHGLAVADDFYIVDRHGGQLA